MDLIVQHACNFNSPAVIKTRTASNKQAYFLVASLLHFVLILRQWRLALKLGRGSVCACSYADYKGGAGGVGVG